ncbi:MAG TPA: protein kinase, partial [Gemmataceae bacterium]|nr:protein kinase [Gemmataceae bacterium]
ALAAVHAHGIIHRDLKPGNVLLEANGRAVLTDFGLARPEENAEPLTSEGMILGTPSYMAPEQAAGLGDRIGPATDLYSLGVVLYQMLTGRLPFEGPPLTVLHRIVHEAPTPPRHYRPDLSPALEAVVLRTLNKDPDQRFPDARSLARALEQARAQAGPFPDTESVIRTAPSPPITGASPANPPPTTVLERAGRPFKGWTLVRAIGWLVGGLLIAGAAILESAAVDFSCVSIAHGEAFQYDPGKVPILLPLLGFTGVAVLVAGLGLLVWQAVESFHTPEGLLSFAQAGSAWSVARLVVSGVPLDGRDDMGETALMRAAANGHSEVVKLLLLNGARAGLRNPFGQTALDVARDKGRHDIVALLQPYTATPDASDEPLPTRPPRPNVSALFLLFALLGTTLATVLWMRSMAQPVTAEEFLNLIRSGQVKSIQVWPSSLTAELSDTSSQGFWSWCIRGSYFGVGPPADVKNLVQNIRDQFPKVSINSMSGVMTEIWPGDVWLVPMLTVPVLLLAVIFLPLLRLRALFPMLVPAKGRK